MELASLLSSAEEERGFEKTTMPAKVPLLLTTPPSSSSSSSSSTPWLYQQLASTNLPLPPALSAGMLNGSAIANKSNKRLEWGLDGGKEFLPADPQIYLHRLFSPIPKVCVHGDFKETDFLEAFLIEEDGRIVEKALDGSLIRLFKRWENKQFDGFTATLSRLKIIYGVPNRSYRLQVTWFERAPDNGRNQTATFIPITSVVSSTSFTVKTQTPKRGRSLADEKSADSVEEGAKKKSRRKEKASSESENQEPDEPEEQ